jgi:UDP-2,3-diacylglucosamine pyrophosphatase LpxH
MTQQYLKTSGYVVSDLHIFGSTSLYRHHIEAFLKSVQLYPVVVLNGDTFDFKRSTLESSAETVRQALLWLSDLCSRAPHTVFHYVVGNHDCQPGLISGISELCKAHANLHLHEIYVRIGECLFVHGDILDSDGVGQGLSEVRSRYLNLEPSRASTIFGEIVTRLRLNWVEYLRHRKESIVPRLTTHLTSSLSSELKLSRRVYFGHTHVPFQDFTHNGISFYNTGSLIRGLRWMPIEFPLSSN